MLTDEEEELFKATFHNLLHSSRPIVMDAVNDLIKKTPKLRHLQTKFSNRQLADKVRTLRKALNRQSERKRLKKRNK